ncbi:MAG TPA: hypothetical protein V6D04_03855 [Candidatus Obscuribacterales bacterium]
MNTPFARFGYCSLLGLGLALSACSKDDDFLTKSYSVTNNTGFDASFTSRSNGDTFSVPNNRTTDFKSETSVIGLFDITSTQTPLRFGTTETGANQYRLYTYGADLEYRITGAGAATTADLTFQNAQGGTSQQSNVRLPAAIPIRVFSGGFVYISAQNRASSGGVTVEIYRRGQQFGSNSAYGGYCIATASGTF